MKLRDGKIIPIVQPNYIEPRSDSSRHISHSIHPHAISVPLVAMHYYSLRDRLNRSDQPCSTIAGHRAHIRHHQHIPQPTLDTTQNGWRAGHSLHRLAMGCHQLHRTRRDGVHLLLPTESKVGQLLIAFSTHYFSSAQGALR